MKISQIVLIALFASTADAYKKDHSVKYKDPYEECCEFTPKARVVESEPTFHADDDPKIEKMILKNKLGSPPKPGKKKDEEKAEKKEKAEKAEKSEEKTEKKEEEKA